MGWDGCRSEGGGNEAEERESVCVWTGDAATTKESDVCRVRRACQFGCTRHSPSIACPSISIISRIIYIIIIYPSTSSSSTFTPHLIVLLTTSTINLSYVDLDGVNENDEYSMHAYSSRAHDALIMMIDHPISSNLIQPT